MFVDVDNALKSNISEETGVDSNKHSKTISSNYLKGLQLRHFLLYDVLPGVGSAIAIGLLWLQPISLIEISLLVGMWVLTGIGVTVGFHRHFTHRSFQTSTPIRVLLTILGSMAAQGPLTSWVALHRRHHEYSDRPEDPHSPRLHGEGIWGRIRGLWHSHFSWMMAHEYPNIVHYAPDILRDKAVMKTSRLYSVWILLGLVIPAILGGVLSGTLQGAGLGFLWGGVVRIFLVGNTVWAINSFGHVYGSRPFKTSEYSTNNVWLAVSSLGESWHNNHHAFQSSAKFGLWWWQIDFGYWVIRGLEILGLAWDVKAPTPKMIEARLKPSSQSQQM
ncbi:putative fatty acid desaturase [Kalymmatonema gypsitolerans NIES-4073]|nr:putative fatty acid desaturase [Scytonema sp. NIES-4073]